MVAIVSDEASLYCTDTLIGQCSQTDLELHYIYEPNMNPESPMQILIASHKLPCKLALSIKKHDPRHSTVGIARGLGRAAS